MPPLHEYVDFTGFLYTTYPPFIHTNFPKPKTEGAGMGRKLKDDKKLKSEKVEIRVTHEEKQMLLELCSKEGGITITQLLRLKVLDS